MTTRVICVGSAVVDYVFSVNEMPARPSKHKARAFEIVGGGLAANAAVAIARLGGSAMLASRLGADETGARIVDDLKSEGVDCTRVRLIEGATSPISAVMVDPSGERMIVNHSDLTMPVSPAWLMASWPDTINAVLVDTRWVDGAKAALARARDQGVVSVIDADHPVSNDPDLLAAADRIAFSADGLAGYAQETDLERALKFVARDIGRWCCVTRGAEGVLSADSDGRIIGETPAFAVDVVDTLGAGDIWHGAFALALGEGRADEDAIIFANAAAALKVTRAGGRKGAPTREEVEQFLTVQKRSGATVCQ